MKRLQGLLPIMKASKQSILAVVGPTASGKSDFALELAEKLQGEIINLDSRQVYKYLDIGTNKDPLSDSEEYIEKNGHKIYCKLIKNKQKAWLFDIVTPDQSFTLSDYLELAQIVIDDCLRRNVTPILVGGTGLYLDGLIKGYNLTTKPDIQLRQKLNSLSVEKLFEIYKEKHLEDALSLNNSDKKNKVRLIRLIEKDGKVESNSDSKYNIVILYPKFIRSELFNKIDERSRKMYEQGLITEVTKAIEMGYKLSKPLMGNTYAEAIRCIKKEISMDDAIRITAVKHRQYATRQITWFEGEGRGYKLNKLTFSPESITEAIGIWEKEKNQ